MNAECSVPPRTPTPLREITGRILRAFFEVHWELGYGYLEALHVRALALAMVDLDLLVECEARIPVHFRGRVIGCFRADLLVERSVIVEVKAVRELEPRHTAQVLNYLRATDVEVGLLVNFGVRPTFKRLVFGNARKRTLRSSAYICGPSPRSAPEHSAALDASLPPAPR